MLNLLLMTLVDQVLDAILHFGITPFDSLWDHAVAQELWQAPLWCLFGVSLVLYLTGHMASVLKLVAGIVAVFAVSLIFNVATLVLSLPERSGNEGLLLKDGLLIWMDNILLFTT